MLEIKNHYQIELQSMHFKISQHKLHSYKRCYSKNIRHRTKESYRFLYFDHYKWALVKCPTANYKRFLLLRRLTLLSYTDDTKNWSQYDEVKSMYQAVNEPIIFRYWTHYQGSLVVRGNYALVLREEESTSMPYECKDS